MVNYNVWLETAPKQLNSGLTIIKKIKNDYIILLGGCNINGTKRYEMLGGRFETFDKTALHTGIREFIEELFNIKINLNKLDKLIEQLITNDHIIHLLTIKTTTSISYFANFKTLELIYNFIFYDNYKIINSFNFAKFIQNRNSNTNKINCLQENGLYEIDFISVVYLSKVHLLPLRNFSINFLNKLKQLLTM